MKKWNLLISVAVFGSALHPSLLCGKTTLLRQHVSTYPSSQGQDSEITFASFDWDDNVISFGEYAPVYIYEKGNPKNVEKLSTKILPLVRPSIGSSGRYANYEFQNDLNRADYSYLWMQSNDHAAPEKRGDNRFLSSIKRTLGLSLAESCTKKGVLHPNNQGPMWSSFVARLSKVPTAHRTAIITAREHSPRELEEGLQCLKDQGLITHLPKREHLVCVNYGGFLQERKIVQCPTSTRSSKALVMKEQLDVLQEVAAKQHTHAKWTFSDDDKRNVDTAEQQLQAALAEKPHRWKNLSIYLWHTGDAAL